MFLERRNLPVISAAAAAAAAAFSTRGEWTAPTQTPRALQVGAWRRRGGMEEGKRGRGEKAREKGSQRGEELSEGGGGEGPKEREGRR